MDAIWRQGLCGARPSFFVADFTLVAAALAALLFGWGAPARADTVLTGSSGRSPARGYLVVDTAETTVRQRLPSC